VGFGRDFRGTVILEEFVHSELYALDTWCRIMIAVVFGRRGSGKSVLGRYLLDRQIEAQFGVGVIVDTLLEHVDVAEIELENLEAVISQARTRGSCPLVRVAVPDPLAFEFLAGQIAASTIHDRQVILMVDELSYWTRPNMTVPGLSSLIRYGRHWNCSIIGVSRRAAETSREFTAQADELYIFAVHEPRDLAYFGEILPPEAMSKIGSLEKFHYLKYSVDGTWTVCPPVNF